MLGYQIISEQDLIASISFTSEINKTIINILDTHSVQKLEQQIYSRSSVLSILILIYTFETGLPNIWVKVCNQFVL